jgi:hypothetical protein
MRSRVFGRFPSIALALLFAVSVISGANLPDSTTPFSVLDANGARGPVPFPHKIHEGVVNPDASFPHHVAEGDSCAGCHHTVSSITSTTQYQECSTCHGPDGRQGNPADREGIELSGREVAHRACIGCHRATAAVTPSVFKNNVTWTRCGECHEPTLRAPVVQASQPPVFLTSTSTTTAPSVVPGAIAPDTAPMNRWDVNPPMRHEGRWYDPYHQNPLKGDLPLNDGSHFLSISAESESLGVQRQTTGTWSPTNGGTNLLERGNQWAFRENLLLTFDLSSKSTAFRPAAWRVSFTPAFSFNFLRTQRAGIPFEDVAKGLDRRKAFATVQSFFADFRLGDTPKVFPFLHADEGIRGDSPYFDSTSVRFGIQPFVSDFRGFIFNDTNLGARVFGNASANRYQFNLAGFSMLQKDVDSELNTWLSRGQTVVIGNIYRQDTFLPGYTMQFSFHYNHDRGGGYTDQNGFVDRPVPADLDAVYFGWAGEGHLGRLNLTHALYQAVGRDGHNLIADRPVTINAQFGAAEASVTEDWIRFKAGFLYASGDSKPYDGTARGFDAIMDMPDFAGGRFSFWNAQPLRLVRTEFNLDSQNSLLPSMRSNKFAGVSNFVNPGLILYNAGFDADLKPKVRFVANWNYVMFDHTQPISAVIGVNNISTKIGLDNGFGFRIRPLLNENFTIDTGYSFLFSGEGIRQIYGGTGQAGAVLHAVFLRIRLVY